MKKIKIKLPLTRTEKEDVFVGLNGVSFYFLRGRSVEMAAPLMEILKNTGNL